MAAKAKTCLLFLFPVAALLLSATVTLAFSQRNDDIVMCEIRCEQRPGEEQPTCKQECKEYHDDPERYHPGGHGGSKGRRSGGGGGRRGRTVLEILESNNPYVFEDRHFTARLESQLGNVRVLQKFNGPIGDFPGIEEYRVGFLEAEPETFIIPNHWDAEAVLFVVNGEGTISLINRKSRQSFNIKRGDIFRVPAGISTYIINRNNNQKLVLAKILRSISVPGELQTFFSAGGENRESSVLNAFSPEILEAAFDTSRNELERLFFGPQMQKGVFKKATREQIKSLEESRISWPFGEKNGPKTRPFETNNGHLHEVDANDFSDLRDANVALSFFNISQGSLAGPFYNTKSTMVLVVPNGEGRF
ncbi:hypothetical protein OSB04_022737 [Centaurea solstitialis]|uniref:Cupin type-1 domain-containing protein n=1 Tax=Centaurea solstitialis TaxID=347529 RepID=A0AA38SHU4_9ASTR|nr:hypothetical protein OSB04_022737 [Centaurea solstitialis]